MSDEKEEKEERGPLRGLILVKTPEDSIHECVECEWPIDPDTGDGGDHAQNRINNPRNFNLRNRRR